MNEITRFSQTIANEIRERGYELVTLDEFERRYGKTIPCHGVTNHSVRVVGVDVNDDPVKVADTLSHELGHILCRHDRRWYLDTADKEVEAQLTSHALWLAAGMDNPFSYDYVMHFAGQSRRPVDKHAETARMAVANMMERIAA